MKTFRICQKLNYDNETTEKQQNVDKITSYINGTILNGLVARRTKEAELYFTK